MNTFVCSVKSYFEVGSRYYLVASDKRSRLLFGIDLQTPQKEQKLGEKVFGKNSFQVKTGPVKRTEARQG